jgi:hypothetical protein
MKKILPVITGLIICAGAYTLNIKPGWQLLGTEHDINVSVFNNPNIVAVWAWDDNAKKWEAFLPNLNIDLSKYDVLPLTKIDSFKGYWVKSTANFSVNINSNNYPIGEFIGHLWGLDWYKTKAFYPGDERYVGNDVYVDYNVSDLILRAYKKDNKDSRAQAVANLPNVKRFSADVNLIKDGKYSLFQTIAMASNIKTNGAVGNLDKTDGLYFWAALSIRKNSISYWWEIGENASKYYDVDVFSQHYDNDLTDLTNKSDIKVAIDVNGSKITYKVYNLANGNVIFNKSLDINTTKMTNFTGFNKVIFRSRVKDNVANQNGEEAMGVSENIINTFNYEIPSITLDEFLNKLNFTPISITNNELNNKTVILLDYGMIYNFKNDGYIALDEYEDKNWTGIWNIKDNVIVINPNSPNARYAAIKDKNGSLTFLKAYNTDDGFIDLKGLILDTNSDNLVENGTPLGNINNDMIAGKTFVLDEENNETIKFNSDGTFVHKYVDDNGEHQLTGSWQIFDNKVKLNWNIPAFGEITKAVIFSIGGKLVIIGFNSNGEVIGINELKSFEQ